MAASKKSAKNGNVFDVAHPGKGRLTPPSTSKPVIISNRPVIKDDVVNENVITTAETAPVLTRPKKVVIVPLSEDVSTVDVAVTEPTKAESEPKIETAVKAEPATVPAPKPTPAEPTPAVTTETGEPVKTLEPEPTVAVPAERRDDKQLSPMQAEEALKLSQERAAKYEHMIEAEQYFLPINAVEQRRSRRFAILGLIIVVLLAAAWYDTALDAGLVPNSFNLPHTSFFSVK